MNPTYNVKFWEIRANNTSQGPGKPKRVVSHTDFLETRTRRPA
ncbi:hypothetical protein [Microbispora sp. H13382]|nr:hypothetical protein [Microbispora sp. H13382]